jgi:hypothetical protein
MRERRPGYTFAIDQLQLDFSGIQPLSEQQQISAWLQEVGSEDPRGLEALLVLRDHVDRDGRTKRWMEIQKIQSQYHSDWGWLIPGGEEAIWLYDESQRAYVCGLYLAALLCSHAACERVLSGCLLHYEDKLKKGWRFWGLGPLASHALQFGLIDIELKNKLDRLNEIRKVSAHYKPPLCPTSVHMRVFSVLLPASYDNIAGMESSLLPLLDPVTEQGVRNAETNEDALEVVLAADAMLSLEVATQLLHGNQGFTRVLMWRNGD